MAAGRKAQTTWRGSIAALVFLLALTPAGQASALSSESSGSEFGTHARAAGVQLAQVRGRPGGGGSGGGPSGFPLGGVIGTIITTTPPPLPPSPPPGQPKSKPPQSTPPKAKAKAGTGARPVAVAPQRPAAEQPAAELRSAGEVLTLVSFDQPADVEDELAARFGLERIEQQPVTLLGGRVQRYRIVVNVDIDTMVVSLSSDPRVIIAQPNFRYRGAQQQDAAANKIPQYALDKLAVTPVRSIAQGKDVVVAVIDTGVDTKHPAIEGAILQTFNAVSDSEYSAHSHGTSLAGVIAGSGRVEGVAPQAKLLAVRALYLNPKTRRPETSSYILLKAIEWAFSQEARIFNLSFEGPEDPLLQTILNASAAKGAVHVAAAGNGGPKAAPAHPAAYDSVIAVTATDTRDRLYAAANQGDYLELAAPGVDIIAPATAGTFGYSSGTSLAAAHISGVVALLREVDAAVSAEDVRGLLANGAIDLGPKGRDSLYGAGRPDMQAILERAGKKP